MSPSRSGGKLGAVRDRVKGELLDDTRQGDGTYSLVVGLVSGSIWLFLAYGLPGRSWWETKFLVVAVCFVSWGMADVLPHRWRTAAAILRAAVVVFLLAFGAWIVFDLLSFF